jgi:predicted GNAT family N-acyltransferase
MHLMNMEDKFLIELGSEVSRELLLEIDDWRVKLFNSTEKFSETSKERLAKQTFMILQSSEGKLLGFARLHHVDLKATDMELSILGLASVFSTTERQGYGSSILEKAKEIAGSENKPLVGFCRSSLNLFYTKSGFTIVPGGQQYFRYLDEEGRLLSPADINDLIYVDDHLGHLEKLLNTENMLIIPAEDW